MTILRRTTWCFYTLGEVALGASYTTPQKAKFENVYNFDAFMGDTIQDDLDLEAPATYVLGIAYTPVPELLLSADLKYYEWAEAAGYEDFDWDNQWVIAVGAQFQANDKTVLRIGYNYGENPVNEHEGFDPMGVTVVQGTAMPTLGYELFRTVGFPAIVESHLTLGVGYQLTESMGISLEYMHAFENTISQSSAGGFIGSESTLEEDSYSFALSWQFE